MLMGYLSCKATSAVSTSDSLRPRTSKNPNRINPQETLNERSTNIQEFSYKDLEDATNGFSRKKLLGKGGHRHVYKGVLKNGSQVAVKKPSRSSENNEIENEYGILSKLRSSRFVNLVGFCYDNDCYGRLLVVEFMCKGTLYNAFHSDSSYPPNWGRRIDLALQIAKAIDVLHSQSPPVIHRDVKSENVLLDDNCNARLGDFGMALRCHADNNKLMLSPSAGTLAYMDPSYLTADNVSPKIDVFSFGILMLEIMSGRKAIDVRHSPPSIDAWANSLIRKGDFSAIYDPRIVPLKDSSMMKELAMLAGKCVKLSSEKRPTMKEVVDRLSRLRKPVSLHPWSGVTNPCLVVETVGRPVQLRRNNLFLKLQSSEEANHDDGDCV